MIKKCHGLYKLAQFFFLHFAPLRKLKFISKNLLLNLNPSVPGLSGDNFRFDVNGDGPARYNIIHYKQVSPGNYQWVNVGYFQDDKIQLNMDGKRMLELLSYIDCSVSQPVGRGPQVGRRELSMGHKSSHFTKFYFKTV